MTVVSSVIIADDFQGVNSQTLFYDAAQKAEFADLLNNADAPLLAQLQNHTVFKGRTRWSDLDHDHFRTLIALHLTLVVDLRPHHRADPTHPVVRSLNTLMIAYLVHLERRMQGTVSAMVVTRLSALECRYSVTTLLGSDVLPPPRPHGLRVVVNNIKK